MQLTTEELYNTRAEEVQELLSKPPTLLMRWGIPMLFFIFVGVLVLSYFIRYPDTVVAQAWLTSSPPPVRLMTKSSGYLKLLISEGATVEAGKPLAYIQNPANLEAVLKLEKSIEKGMTEIPPSGVRGLSGAGASEIPPSGVRGLSGARGLGLGELQPYYDVLRTAQKELQIHAQYPIQAQALQALASQIWREKMKAKNLQAQDKITKDAFLQSYKNYKVDSLLYTQKVKTPVEFNQAQGEHLRQRQTLKSSEANILTQNAQIASMREKQTEMRLQASEQDAKLLLAVENAFQNLTTQLALWKHRYLLTAPVAGKVHFLQYWADNQYIGAEQELLTLTPQNTAQTHTIRLKIPAQGAGKVQVGQRLWLELVDFPAQEYGKLESKILQITPILQTEKSKDEAGQYTAVAELKALKTDYQKTLIPKPEMLGQAYILTVEYSLMERFLQPLRKALGKN